MFIHYAKVRQVKDPVRAHDFDAGIDFFVPNGDDAFYYENGNRAAKKQLIEIALCPNESALIPSGIKMEIAPGFVAIFRNKSFVASEKHIVCGADIIDSFYDGEIHIDVHNIGNNVEVIRKGMKIIQMLIVPVVHVKLECVDEKELYDEYNLEDAIRGVGGFGSTGTK